MMLILLVACAGSKSPETGIPEQQEIEEGESLLASDPSMLEFGVVGGASATSISLLNTGDEDVTLLGAEALSTEVEVTLGDLEIPPGGSVDLDVTWSPLAPEELSTSLSILGRGSEGGDADLSIPVTGTASWPVVGFDVDDVTFSVLNVGCDESKDFTLLNAGTEDLVVDGISLATGERFTLSGVDADLPAFPWTLAPGAGQTLRITFTPMESLLVEDALQVSSNDPLNPVFELSVIGEGNIEAENSITYEVGEQRAITVLFAMNEVATLDFYAQSEYLVDGLVAFFDILNDERVQYRVTFIENSTGEVYGDIPYIDDSFSTDEALEAFDGMIEASIADNDYLLATFDMAIPANRDWLLDDGDIWEESRLTMVAINSDVEQSSGNATYYVNRYLAYKEDPEDIVVSAITGDFPRGCTGAEPAELLYNATVETGGTLYSFCADEWTTYLEDIAVNAVGEAEAFVLTGEPAAWSIEVYVDGDQMTEGWTYDEAEQAIVFDDEHYPEPGATVRIDYLMATDCDA